MKKSATNLKLNSIGILWLFSLVLVLSSILPASVKAQEGMANFSGEWAFNESKSELGDRGRRFGNGDLVATQKGSLLTVEREWTNRDGQSSSYTSKYDLEGKETTNSFGRGESKSSTKWSSDGKSLTITTTMSFNGNDWTSTDVWTLSDKNTLSVQSTRPNRDGGETKTTRVYDKK